MIGENNPGSKVSDEIVKQIRLSKKELGNPEYKSVKERAELFNLTESSIYRIDNGTSHIHSLEGDEKEKAEQKRKEKNERSRKMRDEERKKEFTFEEYTL
jgi:hypothetical protein